MKHVHPVGRSCKIPIMSNQAGACNEGVDDTKPKMLSQVSPPEVGDKAEVGQEEVSPRGSISNGRECSQSPTGKLPPATHQGSWSTWTSPHPAHNHHHHSLHTGFLRWVCCPKGFINHWDCPCHSLRALRSQMPARTIQMRQGVTLLQAHSTVSNYKAMHGALRLMRIHPPAACTCLAL